MSAVAEQFEQHLARFRLNSFRPGQREVISAVLAGSDCLCIMPTGGGKSLCYQLPAVARAGLTLVVSPLIALMKDQVDALHALGIAATCINSSLSPREQLDRLDAMAAGQFDLVYVAPERLRSSLFVERLRATRLQLLAVDEAHCISQWGHDFRPDYARIGLLRQRLGNPQTIALTATATPQVRGDIAQQLRLREPKVFITGFARPNLHFEVQLAHSEPDKEQTLLDFLGQTPGAGIIYASTRKRCENLVEMLRREAKSRRVGLYHAGLEQDERRRVQDEFMSGRTPIIVATNAFGMGIDKADLRLVVHYNIPGSLEAYYQEAGRAGRDAQPSRCLLIYTPKDRSTQEFFIDSSYPEPEVVKHVYDYLRGIDADPIELTLDEIKDRLNLNVRSEGISACEKLLEGVQALERLDSRQNMAGVKIDSDLPTLVELLPKEAKVQRRVLQAVERIVGELRGERVFINPRLVAKAAETDPAAASRALRELSKLQAFDYVPPFRGRAVHMLERKKPFEKLGIDFDEQQRRKAAEYAKLERMIAYATARRCRQLEILDYFGDPAKKQCGACDRCAPRTGTPPTHQKRGAENGSAIAGEDHTPKVVEAVRIALSGAARMKGRYGKQLLARMLIGSRAKEVARFRLDKLSTFGLLAHLTEPQTMTFIDALMAVRLLTQIEETPHRPLVRITPRGEEVMMGSSPLTERLSLPAHVLARLQSGRPSPSQERRKTSALSNSNASSPVEIVAFDSADSVAAATCEQVEETVDLTAGSKHLAVPSHHYWTWRVLAAGFSPDECRQIRRVDDDTLFDHVLRAAREGQPVEARWLLSAEQLALLEQAVGDASPQRLKELLSRLPAGIKYRDVQLYLLSRKLAD